MKHFFTADTHFGHENIIKYCARPFANAEEMDAVLIENWNNKINDGDLVYHLGDFSWGNSVQYRAQLNGDIIFLRGNHDKDALQNKHLFLRTLTREELTLGGQFIVMSHYAMRVWNKSHFNAWHLYGHSHGTLPPEGKSWDVGVDYNDYAPISFEELKSIMDARPNNVNLVKNLYG